MPTANPLEQLRRRMQSHASPAAFAAAAEEHRRAGRFAEAIAVCRDGLDRYPTYASARVTLGRALLDSGDAAAAVAELEQAVSQAPDNLAASRALEAARAALGELAETPAPADPGASLAPTSPEAGPAVADAGPWDLGLSDDSMGGDLPGSGLRASVADDVLEMAADGPQEFGLGPDWLPTGPGLGPDPQVPPQPVDVAALPALTDPLSPTADVPLQGDEPAGIWPAPRLNADDLEAPGGAPVYSWGGDPSTSADTPPGLASSPSIWDEPTIEAPWPATQAPPEPPPDGAVTVEPDDLSADPGGSGQWTGLFIEPVTDGAAPAVFSGWDDGGPSAREVPTWSDAPAAEPVTSAFTVPGLWEETPAAGQGDVGDWRDRESCLPPASHTPEWQAPATALDSSAATPEAMGEWTIVTTPEAATSPDAGPSTPVADRFEPASPAHPEEISVAEPLPADAGAQSGALAPSMWEGSVASAVGEVFARAGHGGTPDDGSLEPPMHHDPAVRDAMADTAVEATLEDVAQHDDGLSPALVTLQQMLDAVRARRAALHADMEH